jgi:cysteine-rich repeat protein
MHTLRSAAIGAAFFTLLIAAACDVAGVLRPPHLEVLVTDTAGIAADADTMAVLIDGGVVQTRTLESPVGSGLSITLVTREPGERTVTLEARAGSTPIARAVVRGSFERELRSPLTVELGTVCSREADGEACALVDDPGLNGFCVLGACIDSVCGDGFVTGLEECDDQNDDDADACVSCALATCGDGVLRATEACDEGEDNSDEPGASCRTDCTVARCGDDVVDPDEECDEGEDNGDSPDRCRATCASPSCGDGVVDTGEVCDDGNLSDGDACSDECQVSACGDGTVSPDIGEECEPPGTAACTDTCRANVCGDGFVHAPFEACDDGNTNPNDGCRACRDTAWVAAGALVPGGGAPADGLSPTSLASRAGTGELYIVDEHNHRVLRQLAGGELEVVAGAGVPGDSGDGQSATTATLSFPAGVAIDGDGNLYITDRCNNSVRKVDTDGIIRTFYRFGPPLAGCSTNDKLGPRGIAVSGSRRLFVAHTSDDVVYATNPNVNVSDRNQVANMPVFFGNDTADPLEAPRGVAVREGVDPFRLVVTDDGLDGVGRVMSLDSAGVISEEMELSFDDNRTEGELHQLAILGEELAYVADRATGQLLEVDVSDANPMSAVTLKTTAAPRGVAVHGADILFTTEASHQVIKHVEDGDDEAIAGDGTQFILIGENAAPTTVSMTPKAVSVAPDGSVYVVDQLRAVVWEMAPGEPVRRFAGTGVRDVGTSIPGSLASETPLLGPSDVFATEDVVYITDEIGGCAWKVGRVGGVVRSTSGCEGGGVLSRPVSVARDPATGDVFVSDLNVATLVKIDDDVAQPWSSSAFKSSYGGASNLEVVGDRLIATRVISNRDNRVEQISLADPSSTSILNSEPCPSDIERVCEDEPIINDPGLGEATGFKSTSGNVVCTNRVRFHCQRQGFAFDRQDLVISSYRTHTITRGGEVVAGSGVSGALGDLGEAGAAQLRSPSEIAVGPSGELYIVDAGNGRVRVVSDAVIDTFAGRLHAFGDGPFGAGTSLGAPTQLLDPFVADGLVPYVDAASGGVRALSFRSSLDDGEVRTLVGRFAGDAQVGTLAAVRAATVGYLTAPRAIGMARDLGLVFVAESNAERPGSRLNVIEVDAAAPADHSLWSIRAAAGSSPDCVGETDETPVESLCLEIGGVAWDEASQVLYAADTAAHVIRTFTVDAAVDPVALVPGPLFLGRRNFVGSAPSDGVGPRADASLKAPTALAVHDGALLISDTGNHRVLRAPLDGDAVEVLVGAPNQPFLLAGDGPSARVNAPRGLRLDAAGNLFIAATDGILSLSPPLTRDGTEALVLVSDAGCYADLIVTDADALGTTAGDDSASVLLAADECLGSLRRFVREDLELPQAPAE